jgi:hypothetical protein
MKHLSIRLLPVLFILCSSIAGLAQDQTSSLPLTADSLATGNGKDVFKSFFQLAFDHLTNDNRELKFSSNPYAIMTRMDSSLLIDRSYLKYKYLRSLNFSFSGKLDSAYKFNGFSSGITYAIYNGRDETVSRAFVEKALHADQEFTDLNVAMTQFITMAPDRATMRKYNDELNGFFSGALTLDKLDTVLQQQMKNIAAGFKTKRLLRMLKNNPALNIRDSSMAAYKDLREDFQKGWLWTAGVSDTTYKDRFFLSNIVLSTQVLKGISHARHVVGVELNLQASYQWLDDSLRKGRDLRRQVLDIQPGLNLVFTTLKNNYSWAELKISGEYNRVLQGGYEGEKRDSLTFNGTLRLRLMKDLWLPLEIKYDPASGNVLGFLSVRLNFGAGGGKKNDGQ